MVENWLSIPVTPPHDGIVISLALTLPSTLPIRALHRFGLFCIAPCIITFISGSISIEAHTYLPRPIVEFSYPEEVTGVMEKAGLIKLEIYHLTSGAATIYVSTKDARDRLLEFHANL
jgi:ubiquinone/menaquinone biosynthesis C-methylase UbiE